MSQLPRRPSISHLRKQAKDLLRRLRQQNPNITLTEAQDALAREYGFDSWSKLKMLVELLAGPRAEVFRRYTPKAREALFFSRYEACQMGSSTIEPEHMLLGLMHASQGLKGRMFDGRNASLERARVEMASVPSRDSVHFSAHVSMGERTQQVVRAAADEADLLKHADIGLVHLLLGVLREPDSKATILLGRLGIQLESIRNQISLLLDEEPL